MKLSNLGGSAKDLLDAIAAQLVKTDPNFDLPGDQYVGAGEIPWDGPGLYVYLGGSGPGQPGRPETTSLPSAHASVFMVTLYVQLVRIAATFGYWSGDTISPADPAILNGQGIQAINDAGALTAALAVIKQGGTIARRPTGFVIGQAMPLGPRGGMAGVRIQVDVSIDEA